MSIVKQTLILEIRQHIANAVEWKQKIDSAKTETKRSVYKKKLKKNNIAAADLFTALDKLVKNEVAHGVKDEVPVLEGRTQETNGNKSSLE